MRLAFPRIRGFSFWLFVVVSLLDGAAFFSIHTALQEFRERDFRQAETETQDLTLAVSQSGDTLIGKADAYLSIVVDDIERRLNAGQDRDYAVRRVLSHAFRPIEESEDLTVTDSDGKNLIHETHAQSHQFDVGDRAYFKALKSGYRGLYVSRPLISRLSGAPILVLSRGLWNPDGSFGGAVAMAVPLEHFQKIVSGYTIGERSFLTLMMDDFSRIVRHKDSAPDPHFKIGVPPPLSEELQRNLKRNPQKATYSATTPFDGERRLVSYNRLSTAPIYAVYGMSEEEFLQDWYELRIIALAGLGIFVSLSFFAACFLHRSWLRQRGYASGLQKSNRRLQTALADLQETAQALNAAREVGGLSTFSMDFRGGMWSRSSRQEEILGIGPDYPHTIAAWWDLIHEDDRPLLEDCIRGDERDDGRMFDLEFRIVRPCDGATRWLYAAGKVEFSAQGDASRAFGAVKDVSERKEQQARVEHLAYHDLLTDLPNRALLADRLRQAQIQARRRGEILAVCYLDLDGFKEINDTWGHDVGDRFLVEVGNRLRSCTRAGDTVARLGGDEFVVLLCGFKDEAELACITERMLATIGAPYAAGDKSAEMTMSMGVTVYPHDDEEEGDVLIRHADQAMYEAKRSGKNRCHRFDSWSDRLHHEHLVRHARIVAALEASEFRLHYQPKVELRTGRISGLEALIRWQHPERGLLLPGLFLPDVENTDFTQPLGEWVLREVLRQKRAWMAQGLDIPVGLNVFGRHLQQADFAGRFREILGEFPDVPPHGLGLEILETTAMYDLEAVSRRIQECAHSGVEIALDDFGTGYSSLTYFRHLPVTQLKIDKSFVGGILKSGEDLALVEHIIGMAHALDRKVVAEGVETLEHGIPLLRLGCDGAQGFGISRPMPEEQVVPWIRAWRMPPPWQDVLDQLQRTYPEMTG